MEAQLFGLEPRAFLRKKNKNVRKRPPFKRRHKTVDEVHQELGVLSRRAFRLEISTFWRLFSLLSSYLDEVVDWSKCPVNGCIDSSVHLCAAIRYFAGACPIDVALVFGISHIEVFESIWRVVDAINACPALNIVFPEDHEEQRKMAKEIKNKSGVAFGNCADTIDGILIWTSKPRRMDCDAADAGAKKFYVIAKTSLVST